MITLGRSHNGESGGSGSGVATSRPARAIRPARSALDTRIMADQVTSPDVVEVGRRLHARELGCADGVPGVGRQRESDREEEHVPATEHQHKQRDHQPTTRSLRQPISPQPLREPANMISYARRMSITFQNPE